MHSANLKSSFGSSNSQQNNYMTSISDSSYSNRIDYNNSREKDELSQYLRIYSANSRIPKKKYRNNLMINSGLKTTTSSNFSLEYLPKSKIMRDGNNFFGKTSFSYCNKKEEKERLNKINKECKIILNEKNERNILEEINKHSEVDTLKFRNEFILKYAKIAEYYKNKYRNYKEAINPKRISDFDYVYFNLDKLYEKTNTLILDEIKCDEKIDYNHWKNLIYFFFNFTNGIVNMIDFLYDEIKYSQNENYELKKELTKLENDLNKKNSDLKQVNNYINKYKINKAYSAKKELGSFKLETDFLQKENTYILTIYKLEEEIRGLTELLQKNSISQEKLKSMQNDKEQKTKELDSARNKFNKEMNDVEIKMAFLRDQLDNFKMEKNEMQSEIKQLKDQLNKKNHLIYDLEREKEEISEFLKEKDNKMKKLKEEIYFLENKGNNIDNNLIDIPVNTVMTTSHNV